VGFPIRGTVIVCKEATRIYGKWISLCTKAKDKMQLQSREVHVISCRG
jgi:hypothetical protein